ncbi:MAG: DUF2095 family protein [Candidatus Hodarchaeota archaeon]
MPKDNKKKKKLFNKVKIKDIDGLNISYDQQQLEHQYPNLMAEISEGKKIVKINSIRSAPPDKNNNIECYEEDLRNPGAIDFIRRCESKEQAIEILNYLLKRKEITLENFSALKNQINQKGGLKRLIDGSGGPKTPGYYERKYYKKKKYNQS